MFCVWTNQKYVIPDFGLFTCDQVMVGAQKVSLGYNGSCAAEVFKPRPCLSEKMVFTTV